MKIVISKSVLEMAVKNLCRVINPKNVMPILGDIRATVNEQERTATLISSDSEIWLRLVVSLQECEGGGEFCVGADTLRQALSELPEQPLTILATTESDNRMTIRHQTGETHMPLDPIDDYPTPQPMDAETNLVTLSAQDIQQNIKRTLWATDSNDLRPIMTGILFDFMKMGTYNVVASDGHVLMRCHVPLNMDGGCKDASFIMPKKVAKILPDMLMATDTADVTFSDRMGCVEQGTMSLTFRLIEGRYPKYGSVIPSDYTRRAIIDRPQLLNRLRNVLPFANDSSQMVRLHFEADHLELQAEDYDFSVSATDSVECELEGSALTLGVKGSSLIAVLSKLTAPRVVIKATDPSHAITIEDFDEGEGNVLGLCMPMLLNE